MVVHHIYKWFPHRDRALPAGIATAGAALGLAVAAPALSAVIVNFGWRAAFAVLGVVGVIWVAVWLLVGREGPYTTYQAAMPDDGRTGPASGADSGSEARVPYRKILTSGTWLGATLGGHVAYWAIAIWSAWLPSYLERGLGYSPLTSSSLMVAPALVGAAAMIGGGAVCRGLLSRGGSTRWACGVLEGAIVAVGGLALLALVVFNPPGSAQIALLAIGFGLPFGALPLANMPVAEVSPVRQRAAVMSFSVVGMTLAGLFAPAVAGALIGAAGATPVTGYHHMMLLVGLLLLAGGVVAAVVIHPRRDARKLGLAASGPTAVASPATRATGLSGTDAQHHDTEPPQ